MICRIYSTEFLKKTDLNIGLKSDAFLFRIFLIYPLARICSIYFLAVKPYFIRNRASSLLTAPTKTANPIFGSVLSTSFVNLKRIKVIK